MGIKYLNKYLHEKCKTIKTMHLKNFANKTIVIDTSIYMYKFLADNALITNMAKMIRTFEIYKITPLFIFDGKPPPEKKELLIKRNLQKNKAEEKYNELLSSSPNSKEQLISLKNQFLRITEVEVNQVKEFFDSKNIRYISSPAEADPICVHLVNSNEAFACLTEDMDMFVYGCHRILRNIDFKTNQVEYYSIQLILKELNISYRHFKQILVLSGTDYNIHHHINLYNIFSIYEKYKNQKDKTDDFYEWLQEEYPSTIKDMDKLNHCYNMFDLSRYKYYSKDERKNPS